MKPLGITRAQWWVLAHLSRVRLTGNPQEWFHQDEPVLMSLNDVDAVIERTDPPFNMEYVYATYLLERAEADGARIFRASLAGRLAAAYQSFHHGPDFLASVTAGFWLSGNDWANTLLVSSRNCVRPNLS